MSQEDPEDGADGIAGLPLDEAVDAVVARRDVDDPATVRATLETVAEDGVVTRAAAEDSLAHVSKVVATPETRVELAAAALADARDAAADVDDVDVVAARLDAFESRLETVEDRTAELGATLQELVGRAEEGPLYELAADVGQLTDDANEAQRAADDLSMDLESFERWLSSRDHRYRELEEDAEALEGAVEDLDAAVDDVADAVEEVAGGAEAGATTDEAEGDTDPGAAWADLSLRRRVMALFVADLRAELSGIRALDERSGVGDEDRVDEIAARIDDLDERLAATEDRLESLARPAFAERFGDRIDSFEATLRAFEPPVSWGEVQAELEAERSALRSA